MRSNFEFTASYTKELAEIVQQIGAKLYVYDVSKRTLMNFNDFNVIKYGSYLNLFDKTPFKLVINFLYLLFFCISHRNYFSFVHILYLRIEFLIAPFFIKRLSDKLIVSIFGSDISEFTQFKKYFKKIFKQATIIHTATKNQFEFFSNNFMGDKYKVNSFVLEYPIKTLNNLKFNARYKKESGIMEKLKIENSDFIILCGNNARFDLEQQYELVDVLCKANLKQCPKLKLVFPLTYGCDMNKRERFKEYALGKLINLDVIFILDYLTDSEIVDIRLNTDIYINIRKRDQLVATMIEYFYTQTDIIAGSWLPYKMLDEYGLYYHKIDNIQDIIKELPIVIETRLLKKNEKLLLNNAKIAHEKWNYEILKNRWQDFYVQMIH